MADRSKSTLETKLLKTDLERFRQVASAQGKTSAQLLRDIALEYLDSYDKKAEIKEWHERDKVMAEALRRIENRFASIIVRLGIDLESLYFLLWTNSDKATRHKLFEKCYQHGQRRFSRKLDGLDLELKKALAPLTDTSDE